MKKRFFSLFLCAALLLPIVFSAHTAWAAPSSPHSHTYTDPVTGATFIVPKDWTETAVDAETENAYQVKFISLNHPGSSFLYGHWDVWSELTESERSGYTRSDIDNAYIYARGMFQNVLVDMLTTQDFDVTADDTHLITYGRTDYIELTATDKTPGSTVTLTTAWHVENGHAYCFMFAGNSDEAAQNFQDVLYSFRSHATESADRTEGTSGSDDSNIYTDPDTGASFVVPKGWKQLELPSGSPDAFQMQFVSLKDPGTSLIYGSVDLWSAATASERFGLTRSDFNSEYIYTLDGGSVVEYWAKRFVQGSAEAGSDATVENIELVTYGKNKFIEISAVQKMYGISVPQTFICGVENGYMHVFLLSGNDDQAIDDFHSMLGSLCVPATEGSGDSGPIRSLLRSLGSHIGLFVAKILIGFLFYALPFLIYRYWIKKAPARKNITLILMIPYEIIAVGIVYGFVFWRFPIGLGDLLSLLFWNWFAYHHAVRGNQSDDTSKKTSVAVSQQPVKAEIPHASEPAHTDNAPVFSDRPTDTDALSTTQPTAYVPASAAPQTSSSPTVHTPVSSAPQTPPAPRIQFCRNCGFRLLADSKFCSCCGTPVVPITKE